MAAHSLRRIVAASAFAGLTVGAAASLAGAVPAPYLISSVGDSSLGTVEVGKTSSPLSFTISSSEPSIRPALDSAPTLIGANASEFRIDAGTCVKDFFLSPTATCTSTVTFAPTSVGSKSATVLVAAGLTVTGTNGAPCAYNAVLQRNTCDVAFAVTGAATAAPAPAVGAAITPATRIVRARRAAQIALTTTNSGNVALGGVVTSLAVPRGFMVTNRGGGTLSGRTLSWATGSLASGASASYAVRLRPIANVARRASLVTTVTAPSATTTTASATIIVVPVRVKKRVPVVG